MAIAKSTHTPGPWRTKFSPLTRTIDIRGPRMAHDGSSLHIAEVSDITDRKENACLIKSAPELLEALEHVDLWAHRGHIFETAQTLGEKYARLFLEGGSLLVTNVLWEEAEAAIRKARGGEFACALYRSVSCFSA